MAKTSSIDGAKRFVPLAQFFKYPRIFTYVSMDISLNIRGYANFWLMGTEFLGTMFTTFRRVEMN